MRQKTRTKLKTKSPAVARIADRTGCQWPSKSSKVNDFHLIYKSVCDFLLVINRTLALSLTVSEIRPLTAWNFPLKTTAKPLQMETWLLLTAYRKSPVPVRWYHRRPPTIYRLATIPHNWHTIVRYNLSSKVIQSHRFSCRLKAKRRLPISDEYQPRFYLAPFSHNTSVTDRQTDDERWTTTIP